MTRHRSEEWQQLIDAQEASDITIAQFCYAHGINYSTFYLKRIKQKDTPISHMKTGLTSFNCECKTTTD